MKHLFELHFRLSLFIKTIKTDYRDLCLLFKGQNLSGRILKLSHQLEKGMCIRNPRPLWGWEKAKELTVLCGKCYDKYTIDTAKGVLYSFIKLKQESTCIDDKDRANEYMLKNSSFFDGIIPECGGRILVNKALFDYDVDSVEKLFMSRHSIRDFDDTEVSDIKILQAVGLANKCPSACNRQPYHVYVISSDIWNQNSDDPNQVYNANKHLLITALLDSFTISESKDWVVSASIFAGYLSLTLSLYGIGSCVIRKDLLNQNRYKKLISACNISERERIVVELAIGNLRDEFYVPVSNRKPVDKVVSIVK